ncbi:unnamed protein product, partial [Polarella glacialis]
PLLVWYLQTAFGASSLRGPSAHCSYQLGSPKECPILPRTRSEGREGDAGSWQTLAPTAEGDSMMCIDGKTPYKFQFRPGSEQKLLIYLMGGGACWDREHTQTFPTCTHEPDLRDEHYQSVFSTDNPTFQDFQILKVGYCSGDGFIGNATHLDYAFGSSCTEVSPKCPRAAQNGFLHLKAAVDWLQSTGLGKSRLDYLALIGASAGAIGLHIWADDLLRRFNPLKASVVFDSYAGIFREGVQSQTFRSLNSCSLPIIPNISGYACPHNLTLQDVLKKTMTDHASVKFVHINSKVDAVQMLFYDVALLLNSTSVEASNFLSQQLYYRILNQLFSSYARHENWGSYLVNGALHTYTDGRTAGSAVQDSPPGGMNFQIGSLLAEPCGLEIQSNCGEARLPSIGQWLDILVSDISGVSGGTDGDRQRFVCAGQQTRYTQANGSVSYCDAGI